MNERSVLDLVRPICMLIGVSLMMLSVFKYLSPAVRKRVFFGNPFNKSNYVPIWRLKSDFAPPGYALYRIGGTILLAALLLQLVQAVAHSR